MVTLVTVSTTHAQESDSARIALSVEAQHFFKNNEYFSHHADGYTLPGFYLRPKVVWRIEPAVSLEAGLQWLHFWGAHYYPAAESMGVWPTAGDSTAAAHVLPWMRAEVRFDRHLTLTLGSLHQAHHHGLSLPFYDPERLFAADPEVGVQLQADYRHFKGEVWVDWREYIWRRSTTQERFTFGLSAEGRLGDGAWQGYLPVHFVAQHVGGQGLVEHRPVQNHFNAAAGLGLRHQWGLWGVAVECHAAAYRQHNAPHVPFYKGWAFYPTASLSYDSSAAIVDVGFWYGRHFVPLMGSPLFSCMGETADGISAFARTRVLTVGARYEWRRFRHCSLALEGRYYNHLITANASQYSVGLYLDLLPSLPLLK